MIETAICTLIKQFAGCADRVYPGGELVDVTRDLPKVVYTDLGAAAPRLYCDDGNAGLVKIRVQLDVFAARPSAARAICDAIRVGLDGYAGEIDQTPIERIYFPDPPRSERPEQLQKVGERHTAARYTQDLICDFREPT